MAANDKVTLAVRISFMHNMTVCCIIQHQNDSMLYFIVMKNSMLYHMAVDNRMLFLMAVNKCMLHHMMYAIPHDCMTCHMTVCHMTVNDCMLCYITVCYIDILEDMDVKDCFPCLI